MAPTPIWLTLVSGSFGDLVLLRPRAHFLVLISVTRTSSKQKKKQRGIHYYSTPRYPELQDLNTASAVAPLCTCTPPLSLCAPQVQVGVLVEAGYSQHACLMPAALRLADGCRSCLDLSQTRQRDLLFLKTPSAGRGSCVGHMNFLLHATRSRYPCMKRRLTRVVSHAGQRSGQEDAVLRGTATKI